MSELCPHSWSAQITLAGEPGRVILDWTEYDDGSGRPAVSRRVNAASIPEALDAMVSDRRTDETLEQIERGALADGAAWGEL